MIYLDNAATTFSSDEITDFALQYRQNFYNPSASYRQGVELTDFLRRARTLTVGAVAGEEFDCVFTSGGTEADNLAIFSGAARGNAVTTLGEHSAVYETFVALKKRGVESRFAAIRSDGGCNVDDLLDKIDEKTSFVSVVHVNNETGAINDINAIAEKVKRKNPKILFHSDGVQAYCKIPIFLSDKIDFYSISGHKIGAFKGTGALIRKKSAPLHPLIYGGGQENGLRSGTENVIGIASLYAAVSKRSKLIAENLKIASRLKDSFLNILSKRFKVFSKNEASPYIIGLSASGFKGEVLQHIVEDEGCIIGKGSSCSSKKPGSRILREAGYPEDILDGQLRVSFCPENIEEEVVRAADLLNNAIEKYKRVSK